MRPIWSGMISFGLINIPVKLFNMDKSKPPSFDLLRKNDYCRISYKRICKNTGEEVPYNNIVKGYRLADGQYVVLNKEDFKKADRRKTSTIELVGFTDWNRIDPKLLEKPYFISPEEAASKAYFLLLNALKKTSTVGLGRYVLRTRERLGAIIPDDQALYLIQLRYARELEPLPVEERPKAADLSDQEIDMAIRLVRELTIPFEPENFSDTYRKELERIIEAKAKGETVRPLGKAPAPTETEDILAKLKESLSKIKK